MGVERARSHTSGRGLDTMLASGGKTSGAVPAVRIEAHCDLISTAHDLLFLSVCEYREQRRWKGAE